MAKFIDVVRNSIRETMTGLLLDIAFCAACIGMAWAIAWAPNLLAGVYFFVCAIACSMIRSSYEEYLRRIKVAKFTDEELPPNAVPLARI